MGLRKTGNFFVNYIIKNLRKKNRRMMPDKTPMVIGTTGIVLPVFSCGRASTTDAVSISEVISKLASFGNSGAIDLLLFAKATEVDFFSTAGVFATAESLSVNDILFSASVSVESLALFCDVKSSLVPPPPPPPVFPATETVV